MSTRKERHSSFRLDVSTNIVTSCLMVMEWYMMGLWVHSNSSQEYRVIITS